MQPASKRLEVERPRETATGIPGAVDIRAPAGVRIRQVYTLVTIHHACTGCGAPMVDQAMQYPGQPAPTLAHVICQACFQKQYDDAARATADAIRHQRTEAFARICPPVYLDTDPTRLPCTPAVAEAVMTWARACPTGGVRNAQSDVKPSLLLHGPTRTGKTRLLAQALRHLVSIRGCSATLCLPGDLARDVADAYRNGEEKRLWSRLSTVDVLCLDDLGKEKLTDRVEAFLFELLERRFSWHRCNLITTNHTGPDLAARFLEPERGAALVARLREFCQAVSVGTAGIPARAEGGAP